MYARTGLEAEKEVEGLCIELGGRWRRDTER